MADPIVNFFKSTLVGTYSDTDTSLTVASGDGALLPDPSTDGAFNLTIFEGLQVTNSTSFEIVRVTARSGDVLTVTRGAESTTPLTIGSATHSILMSATKKTFDDINTAIENIDLTTITGAESIKFDTTGDEEFGLPTGTTAQRPASPSQGYMRYNTDDGIGVEVYNGSRWVSLGAGFAQLALEVAQATVTANDAVFALPLEVEYLVIAGGGGGGQSGGNGAGGAGGAGGYRSSVIGESSGGGASAESTLELSSSTNYTVTVGAGGSGSASGTPGNNGSNSVFSTITSLGGGGGGSADSTDNVGDGGSGGGEGGRGSGNAGTGIGLGTANQGFNGGLLSDNTGDAGGGGGAGSVGGNGNSSKAGDGGSGVSSSITSSSVGRAGGGGGGGETSGTGGTASDGGGAGGGTDTNGSDATINTGGGGGGGGGLGDGGSGGSGVVILRYPSSYSITIGAGLTGTETTDGSEKYAVITAGTGNVSWT